MKILSLEWQIPYSVEASLSSTNTLYEDHHESYRCSGGDDTRATFTNLFTLTDRLICISIIFVQLLIEYYKFQMLQKTLFIKV